MENGRDLLLDLLLEEVRSDASEEEAVAFFRAVGFRLAQRFPLSGRGDVQALEQDLNEVFAGLSLGSAQIGMDEDALIVRHRLANVHGSSSGAWPTILEGAYDAWLRALGSGPRLQTSIRSVTDGMIELRHGL
jgi:hypothetical protein